MNITDWIWRYGLHNCKCITISTFLPVSRKEIEIRVILKYWKKWGEIIICRQLFTCLENFIESIKALLTIRKLGLAGYTPINILMIKHLSKLGEERGRGKENAKQMKGHIISLGEQESSTTEGEVFLSSPLYLMGLSKNDNVFLFHLECWLKRLYGKLK